MFDQQYIFPSEERWPTIPAVMDNGGAEADPEERCWTRDELVQLLGRVPRHFELADIFSVT